MNAARPEILTWGTDTAKICRRVQSDAAAFKVLLKTRNEHVLIERWLAHYLNILGPKARIIILDNMSTDERVFEVYARYADNSILIQYDGNVDTAHNPARFGDLYRAVRASSEWYALLDTDEFLCLYDGRRLKGGDSILSFFQEHGTANLFPSLFLHNLYGRDDAFFFEPKDLRSYHLKGKPVLRSSVMERSLTLAVGHNMDVPLTFYDKAPSGLVLLHMTNLSREQRIQANMQKLASFGLIKDERDFITVLHADENEIQAGYLRGYVRELRWLLAVENEQDVATAQLAREHIEIAPDGTVRCFPESLAPVFTRHAGPDRAFLDLFDAPIPQDADPNARLSQVL